MEGSYYSVPDGDSDGTAESFQLINNSSFNSKNAIRGNAEADTSAHNASTVTQDNATVNNEQKISLLDHSFYDLGDHPNEPIDMSSPIKSGGFYPTFFPDDILFSPITAQSAGYKCSKGTVLCTIEPYYNRHFGTYLVAIAIARNSPMYNFNA